MTISNSLFSHILRKAQARLLKIREDFQFGVYLQS